MPSPKNPKKNIPHPPVKEIDMKIVDQMLEAHSPGTEIASYFEVHPETLYDRVAKITGLRFSEYAHGKREKGNRSVRLKHYIAAMNGDSACLRDLTKEWLGYGQNKTIDIVPDDIRSEIAEEVEARDSEGKPPRPTLEIE